MNAERWQKIEDLFQSARSRTTAGERAAFLDGACADDADLRVEVEALLQAEDSAGSFINTSAVKVAAGLVAAERATEMAGRTIANYKILSAIGAGGMGEVYLATDTRSGRKVALKLLPEHLVQDAERVGRFQQEARAVLALNHPNIVTVYEIGQQEGMQFIASEFVKGETLRARMARAPLKLGEAIEITVQVASALADAHQEGVVHRDIKPENIMLRPDGYVKVLDFGIAKLTEQQTPATQTEAPTLMKVETRPGMVLGSAHYMSPEQARGVQVDERTDIWSLGVVLYEMIAGRVPFDGETPNDCIAAILDKEPPPLGRFAHDVPETLEVIVSTALTKNRDERYHSVRELLGALRRLKQRLDASAEIERSLAPQTGSTTASGSGEAEASQAGESISSTKPIVHSTSSAEYIVSEIKRHKTGVIVALALLTIAVCGVAFALYRILRAGTTSVHAPKFTALTTGGKIGDLTIDGELSLSPDGRYVAYVMRDDKQQNSLWVTQIATNTQAQLIPPSTADYMPTVFSPDGQFIYFGRRETRLAFPTLYRVPLIGGAPSKVLEDVTSVITFSPDGKRFAFVRDEALKREDTRVMVANTDGSGEPKVIARRKAPDYFGYVGPSWSPDGKIIATGAGAETAEGTMTVVGVPVEGGPEIPLTQQKWKSVERVLWLADGSGLIMTAMGEQVFMGTQVWHLSYPDGVARKITNDLNGYGAGSIGVSADSSTIATIQSRDDVQIWVMPPNQDETHARRITKGAFDGVFGLSWTPDGKVLYCARTGNQLDVWRVNADGSHNKQITSDSYTKDSPEASPDGRYIIFASDRSSRYNLWRVDTDGGNPKQLTEGNDYQDYGRFSPDSHWVVFNSNKSGQMSAWKIGIEGGSAVQISDTFAAYPSVSPDGKWVASLHLNMQSNNQTQLQVVIIPFEGGQPVRTINLPPTATPFNGSSLFWFPDGRSITFVNRVNNIPNIWSQPVDGGAPKQLTDFKSSRWLYNYALSSDGNQIAAARGDFFSDIVLIKDFR